MGLKFNPLTSTFDLVGSGGGSAFFAGEVATYADLPLDGTAALNSRWLVRSSSGTWPFPNYRQGGIYIRTSIVGSSRDNDYTLADTKLPDVFADSAFLLYDNSDSTRNLQFDLGSITTGTTRTLTAPNASGTIALTNNSHQPSAIYCDAADVADTTLSSGEPNGIYFRDGSDNGKAIYKSSQGYAIWWDDGEEEWVLGNVPQTAKYYIGTGDTTYPWQATSWALGPQGSGEVPVVDQALLSNFQRNAARDSVSTRTPKTGNASSTEVVLGSDTRLSDDRDPNLHAASHLPEGADELFDQSLDKSDDVEFATVGIGDTPTGSERKFHQHGGKFTVESNSGSYGQFQVINPSAGEVSFVLANEAVANEDGTITSQTAAQTWAFGTGSYSNSATTFIIGNNQGNSVFHVLPDGKVGLGSGNSDPAEALDVDGNIALRDTDNDFAATFDVQSQLSDDVTLTIPDQSGTLAVVTDIPTTAGDVGAVAAGAITTSGLTQATARILGRTSSSTGAIEEIQIGSGLSLSAGELSATGSGITAVGASTADVLSVSGSDLVADDPNADRIVFWDDSESKLRYLEAGSGLSISGTTMTVTATGGATNLWIPASAWIPKTTAGCGVDSRETTTNDQNFDELLFDTGSDELADALVVMPSNYNNGTVTARFYWTAASGSGGVAWGIQGRAFANDDALDTAAGTAQLVTDTLIAANDMHITSATSAVTIGGTPAANTPIQFTIYRDVSDAADTLAVDARLLGVEIIFN
jgi:hypothetical protein